MSFELDPDIDEATLQQIEQLHVALSMPGVNLLIEEIQARRDAADTVKVVPLDPNTLIFNAGHVDALDWVLGIIKFYKEPGIGVQD